MYAVGQLVALALLGGGLVPFAAALTLWYARRRASTNGSGGGQRNRAYLFYRAMAGVLLGQVLCHTWLPVTLGALDVRLLMACVLVGFLLMDAGEAVARVWHAHGYVVVDDDVAAQLDEAFVDAGRMEPQRVVVMENLRAPTFAVAAWALADKERDYVKRQWMLGALFVALAVVTLTDAALLVALEDPSMLLNDILIFCFYLHGFTLSLALLGALLHAKWHLGGRAQRWCWWWVVVGGAWCVALLVVGTGLPLWLGVPPELVVATLQQPGFMVVYGLATGVLLKLHVYYYSRRMDPATTRGVVAWGLVCFWLAAGQACLTGFWI